MRIKRSSHERLRETSVTPDSPGDVMLTPRELEGVIDEVLRGNKDAFRRIVQECTLLVRSYIATQVHHLDIVDDLAQDVLLQRRLSQPSRVPAGERCSRRGYVG